MTHTDRPNLVLMALLAPLSAATAATTGQKLKPQSPYGALNEEPADRAADLPRIDQQTAR